MKCLKCGSENSENALFCNKCGASLKSKPINSNLGSAVKVPAGRTPKMIRVNLASERTTDDSENKKIGDENITVSDFISIDEPLKSDVPAVPREETKAAEEKNDERLDRIYRPMRKRDWLAVFALCAVPVLNIIMLFIWSCSPNTNKSKKSYAQLMLIITAVIVLLLIAGIFILWSVFGIDYLSSLPKTLS